MTAEIGILNRQGVALAADSAVTLGLNGKQKVLNSANKLFNLIKGHPVGLMVYGNGDFLGIPWEVIIHEYRKSFNRKKPFDTLLEYANDFLNKLSDKKYQSMDSYIGNTYRSLNSLLNPIITKTKNILCEKYPNIEIPPDKVLEIFLDLIKQEICNFEKLDFISTFNQNDIDIILTNPNLKQIVEACLKDKIQIDFSDEIINKTTYLCALSQCKDYFNSYTGVVVAGYGDNDLFPTLYEFYVEGIINSKLKYKLVKESKIYSEDLSGKPTSEILPFAQQEMVHSVLTGIDPDLEYLIVNNLESFINSICTIAQQTFNCSNCKISEQQIKTLQEKSLEEIKKMLSFINLQRQNCFVSPVYDMVSSLPKEELANMAETLVNLTSFKRKITMDAETVGGPIDVAVISKSEGFIWIKRKLYFDKNLNNHYS